MNYFEFYGLTPSFIIDGDLLKKQWLIQNRNFHPDRFLNASIEKQEDALEKTAFNNKAYSTLKEQETRVYYLLEINNLIGDGVQLPPLAPDFLMDMIDINETIMDLSMDYEPNKAATVVHKIKQIQENLNHEAGKWMTIWTPEHPDHSEILLKIREFFLKNKYLLRISENVSNFASL